MGTTKHYVFTVFFNFNGDKERTWAQKRREDGLIYLTGLFENKAKFSCIAKDENAESLLLRGYCNLNSPCTREYGKRLLGKCSSLKPSYSAFDDTDIRTLRPILIARKAQGGVRKFFCPNSSGAIFFILIQGVRPRERLHADRFRPLEPFSGSW